MGSQMCSSCQDSFDSNTHAKRDSRLIDKSDESAYFDHSKQELLDFKFDEEQIPKKTLLTIESGHLIAHILKDFFTNQDNICHISKGDMNDDPLNYKSILDNIFIVGGACRDFLLNKPINDLDISCNTRELSKLHKLHLNKYHSTPQQQICNYTNTDDITCVFWRLYLKKFEENTKKYDLIQFLECNGNQNAIEKKSKSYQYIRDCDYLINAKFVAGILTDSAELYNRLSVRRTTTSKVHQLEIIDRLVYNGYDLNGQDFDISDALQRSWQFLDLFEEDDEKQEFHNANRASKDSNEQKNMQLQRNTLRLDSIKMDGLPSLVRTYSDRTAEQLIDIELPVYATKMKNIFIEIDLAINQTTIKMSFLLKENYKSWHKGIFCPLYNDRNAFMKCFIEKVITHPNFKKCIKAQTPQVHFWRIIKFGIRLSDWMIDPNMVAITIEHYDDWLLSDTVWLTENLDKISGYQYFTKHFFKHGYAKDLNGYRRMIEIFEFVKCKDLIINALNHQNHLDFQNHWVNALNNLDIRDKDKVILLFESKGFPVNIDMV